MAAETVPEYVMSLPRLGPVLMPETTSLGRSGARPRNASATQSEGEPSLENAFNRVPGSVISLTRSGRSSVLVCPAAVQLRFGAMTHTSSTPLSARARALSPGESTPSSLVTRIMCVSTLEQFSWSIVQELILRAREVADRAYTPYSHFRVGAAVQDARGTIYVGCNVENASYGLTV